MFVRFRVQGQRLQVSLSAARRVAGRPKQEHVTSLGSIPVKMTVEDRLQFWKALHERLGKLDNKLSNDDRMKLLGQVHKRIPMVTAEEVRALQREREEHRLQFWSEHGDDNDVVGSLNALVAHAKKQLEQMRPVQEIARREIAEARQRIAALDAGEELDGLGPSDQKLQDRVIETFRNAGWTGADIRRAVKVHELFEFGAGDLLLDEIQRRIKSAENAAVRAVYQRQLETMQTLAELTPEQREKLFEDMDGE
jgi:hypothetical protein